MDTAPAETLKRKILKLAWKLIPFTAVLVLTGLIILPLHNKISSKKTALAEKQAGEKTVAKALTNVITLELEPALIMEKISLPGVVKPWISLELVSEIKGKIVHKRATEGLRVNTGDLLAVIDKRDYQNAWLSARASYEAALATEKRSTALAEKDFITQSQLDDAVARVKTTRAALENAKLNLSRCTILSPMKGIVDRVHIETGTFLNPGDPVARILQIDRLKIEVGIPESDVDAVGKLTSFDVTIDALDGNTYGGEYHYLHKTADSMARLYTLVIKVDNRNGRILPDMFARVTIVKHRDPEGLAVPMYSLVKRSNDIGVYVEKDGMVRFRPVQAGFQDGWKTQVVKGLHPGEKVVVVGHRMIEDGERVNVTGTIRDMEELSR